MWSQILPGLRIKLFFTLLLGVAYPLLITGVSQAVFPHRANGSLATAAGKLTTTNRLKRRRLRSMTGTSRAASPIVASNQARL